MTRLTPLLVWPGFSVSVDRDVRYEETGGRERDPDWRHVDAQAHAHLLVEDVYPTLLWVALPCSMGHGDDCGGEGRYECRVCGERVEPGTRLARPVVIHGPSRYVLTVGSAGRETVYAFGEAEWVDLCEQVVRVVEGTLAERVVSMSIGAQ